MPQPAALDTLQEPLIEKYQQAWSRVLAEQQDLENNPLKYRRRARLVEVRRSIEAAMKDLDGEAEAWVANQLPKAYLAGASAGGGGVTADAFSQINQQAVQRLSNGLFNELLAATDGVNASTKKLIRAVAQDQALQKAIEGKTANQAAKEMRRVLEAKGIHAVTYSDGSKHGLGEYSEMAMRTTTAKAYNSGTLGAHADVKFFEIFDGPECGLSFHDDPTLALGLVVDRSTAEKFLISHPRCRRAFGPRPDVTTAKEAKGASSTTTPGQRQAQLEQDAGRRGRAAARNPQARADRLATRQASAEAHAARVQARAGVTSNPPSEFKEVTEQLKTDLQERLLTASPETQKAVFDHTKSSYFTNIALRKQHIKGPRLDEALAEKTKIESTMVAIDTPIRVYRGVDTSGFDLSDLDVGSTFTDEAFTSATINRDNPALAVGAKELGPNWEMLEIRVPPGVRGVYIGDRSYYSGQEEILFQAGLKFRMIDKTERGYILEVVVDPVAGKANRTEKVAQARTARLQSRADALAARSAVR